MIQRKLHATHSTRHTCIHTYTHTYIQPPQMDATRLDRDIIYDIARSSCGLAVIMILEAFSVAKAAGVYV